jgi:alpha-1,2-mannosyltransferase
VIARSVGWAIAGLALLAAIGIAVQRPFGYDFIAYVDASHRLLAGQPLYPPAFLENVYLGKGEFLYEPLAAVVFVPFALLPFELARALWTAILVVVASVVGIVLLRPTPPEVRPWAAAAYVLYLPLVAEITLGNVNLIALALCLLAWHWRARPSLGGPTLAVAVGLKLLPLAIPFFFLAAGARRTVAWAAGIGAALILLSWPSLGNEWRTYAGLAFEIAGAPPTQAVTLVPGGLGPARLILPAIALAAAVIAGRAFQRREGAADAYTVALAAVPLGAPGIWYPYLVFALPLLARLVTRPTIWRAAAAAVAWSAMMIPKRPDSPDVALIGLVGLIAVGLAAVTRPSARES